MVSELDQSAQHEQQISLETISADYQTSFGIVGYTFLLDFTPSYGIITSESTRHDH